MLGVFESSALSCGYEAKSPVFVSPASQHVLANQIPFAREVILSEISPLDEISDVSDELPSEQSNWDLELLKEILGRSVRRDV